LGVALESLIRSQLGAIITVFDWGFVVEQIVGGLFNSADAGAGLPGPWLAGS